MLITIDHPTADKWLAKLNSFPAGQAASPKAAPPKQANPLIRFVSALVVFIVATAIAGGVAEFFYNVLTTSYGNNDATANQTVMPMFAILWVLLMFIGFRVSHLISRA